MSQRLNLNRKTFIISLGLYYKDFYSSGCFHYGNFIFHPSLIFASTIKSEPENVALANERTSLFFIDKNYSTGLWLFE